MDTEECLELVIPYRVVEAALRHLARNPGSRLHGRAGLARCGGGAQLLVLGLSADEVEEGLEVSLGLLHSWLEDTRALAQLRFLPDGGWRCRLLRSIDHRPLHLAPPFVSLRMPGQAMYRLATDGQAAPPVHLRSSADGLGAPGTGMQLQQRHAPTTGMHSRTVPAMGGRGALQRLQATRYAVVAAGRLGSQVAEYLARMDVLAVTIIDPDVLDVSNLDAMALAAPCDIPERGHAGKAAVLARHAQELAPGTRVRAVAQGAQHAEAMAAMCDADVIVSAPDLDDPRFVAASVAAFFLKPHLDLGTGVQVTAAGRRELGIDVRLTLPGESRCLLCWGGLARMDDLDALGRPQLRAAAQDWQARRLGSLRSLNMVAAGLALRALEDLFSGLRGSSVWWRVTQLQGDTPTITSGTAPADPGCPICACAGRGNAGLGLLPRVLQAVRQRMDRQGEPAGSYAVPDGTTGAEIP